MVVEKSIVLTAFGQGESVERISVSLFDIESNGCSSGARNYCRTINKLRLKDDDWVFARIANEYAEYTLRELLPVKSTFAELIVRLDDRCMQRYLREVDSQDLAMALKGTDSTVQDKIFRNMSKRAEGMLKEDIEFMGPVRMSVVEERQEKLADIIRNLDATMEIVLPDPDEKLVD
jgi:flagellar motor switch protein FliG